MQVRGPFLLKMMLYGRTATDVRSVR
jgi:hypothetical protein